MATAELKDNATHADIEAFVDEIVADRAGDQSDAAKLAAETDEATTERDIADEQAGDTDTAVETDGEKTGKEQASWLDDDLKAEMQAAYGLDEQALAEFADREELDRALRLFDRSALEAGRKAMADGDKAKGKAEAEETGKARDEQGRFTKEPPKKEPQEGRYEIGQKFKDDYDEVVVGEIERLRDHYESRLEAYESRFAAMEERFAKADADAEARHFDGLVDALGHADLFGKTGDENAKQLQRRQDLHVAVKAQLIGLESLGRPTELNESLVNRVARMVFADDFTKKELKARTRKIAQQSDGRMGGGANRPTDPPESLREEARRLYKELEGA